MTVAAQLADGRTLEFPDGTDPAVIQSTVKSVLAQSPTGSGPQPATVRDYLGMGARAVMRGFGDVADLAHKVDNTIDPIAIGLNAAQKAVGYNPPPAPTADQAADGLHLATPTTPGQKLGSAIISGAAPAVLFGPEGLALNALAGGASGAASEATRQAGGGPLLQAGAGFLGGFGAVGAVSGAKALAQGVERAAAPFAAAVSPAAADAQAGRVLVSRASDPQAASAALKTDGTLVPGSTPTTFQQTGDLGLGGLERETQTANPQPFAQRRTDQNAARVSQLDSLQTDADPNDVAKALKGAFDQADAETQGAVDDATAKAQAASDAAGLSANTPPEASGAAARDALQGSEAPVKASAQSLYAAIDPDKTMTANVSQTADSAKATLKAIGPVAKPMDGEEAAIFDAAAALPPLSPLGDLLDLKSRVTDEMAVQRGPGGNAQSYRRLTMLNGDINDNLANSISHAVATEAPMVASGALDPNSSLASRIQGWADVFRANKAETGAGGGQGPEPVSRGGPAGGPLPDGAELPPAGGPGSAALDSGLQGNVGSAPTVTPEAAAQLKAADTAYRAFQEAYHQGPVGQVLQKGARAPFNLPDGGVAAKFFHPSSSAKATGFSDMQALLKASPEALPVIEDYAATTLRRAALTDGILDPAKYAKWKASFADSIRALPTETQAKFADAASAAQTVADAMADRTATLKGAQAGAAGRIMNLTTPEDVTRAVGQILRGSEPAKNMMQLARATADNPAARAGLRQAALDHIAQTLISNTESGASGVSLIKADAFQTFMKKANPALRQIFTPEEVAGMEAVARDIQRAKRSENALRPPAGPGTAQDLTAQDKARQRASSIFDALGTGLGTIAGAASHGVEGGVVGAAVGHMGTHLVQSMRAAGISRVQDAVAKALLDPNVAGPLMARTLEKSRPAAENALAKALTAATLSSFSGLKSISQRTAP